MVLVCCFIVFVELTRQRYAVAISFYDLVAPDTPLGIVRIQPYLPVIASRILLAFTF